MLSTFWISPFALLDNVSSYTLKSQKVITSLHLVIIILLVFIDLLYITCVMLQLCAVFETLWTIVHQAPMPMKFSDQEYWSGLPERSSRGSFQPRDRTHISYVFCTDRWVLYHQHNLGSYISLNTYVSHWLGQRVQGHLK